MKGGFLLGGSKPKKPAAKPVSQKQAKPEIEDLTHVKAQSKDERLRMAEVQEAMKSDIIKKKDEWLTPDFLQKLQSNPRLM